jgi:non-specific serine/threonine protein kinase
MPLAIELAAARANVLTAEGIASRMGDTRSLLQNAVRDAPARHQSIQSMLDWSYGLLSPSEQEVFLRLGVFVGGFTLEATQSILGDASVSDALTALSALCDKGLVALVADAGIPRYRLHEAVRAYASERLEAGDTSAEMRNRHADYYLRLAERENSRFRHLSYLYTPLQLDEAACQPGSRAWAEELAQDDGNLQSAIAWLSSSSRPHHQLRLTAALQWFWWMRGQLDEGVRRLVDALENDDGSAKALRVDALCGLGILYRQSGQGESAATVLAEAVALARELDDDQMLARSLSELATVDVKLGRLDEAESRLDAGIRAWLRTEDEWGAAMAEGLLGSVAHLRGRTDEAVRRCQLAATEFLRLGDRRSATVARYLGAAAALDQNDPARARAMVLESLGAVDQLGEPNLTAAYLELSAWAIAPTAYGEDAARILGCAQSLRSGGFARVRQEELIYQHALEAMQSALQAGVLETNIRAGAALPATEAMALAHATLELQSEQPESAEENRQNFLSTREQEVLELIAAGWSNGQIGKRLSVSESTVKFHVTAIFNKLGVNRRTEAVAAAIKRGILSLDSQPDPPALQGVR